MADEDKKKANPVPEEDQTGGEVVTDPNAQAQVLGEDRDEEFDAVSHGQQTALENHQAEQRSQPTS